MGHLFNYGSYDIFKSRYLGDRWELPNNVGPLINDAGSQEYFSISGDGKYIYYANATDVERDRVKQDFDLFSFKMPMEARPDADADPAGDFAGLGDGLSTPRAGHHH